MAVRDELEKITQEEFVEAVGRRIQESLTASQYSLLLAEHITALANRYPLYRVIYAALTQEVLANPHHGDHRCGICWLEGQREILEVLTML
jgi:recombinational DNA repair protein (RecF pathway)